ncbi:HNH endonuclease [Flavisolibacter nicotianae]|uniref:HNH endonuclease n=1 Tax=Flavisolibacter nicotianae TaxID=2364882 RepID=UPI000EAFB1FB|nr:HNH endonuclease [Flavisolibacter nicotianae]
MAIYPGDIISHAEMCMEEGVSLQKGMNFRLKGGVTVILMSLRKGAPYADMVEDNGETLVYEGHDVPRNLARDPKSVDQPYQTPKGALTENGKFFEAAEKFKKGLQGPELIKVYEKIKDGIWVYNGVFELVDAWIEKDINRNVFKFKLHVTDKTILEKERRVEELKDLDHNRMIPTSVKLEVWKRDKGRCVECGSTDNLHFDHILPFSKGGTSLKTENIQLLCARHNLSKSDRII